MAGTADDSALGFADPGNGDGYAGRDGAGFCDAFASLDRRIGLFLSLPLATLDNRCQQESRGLDAHEDDSLARERCGVRRDCFLLAAVVGRGSWVIGLLRQCCDCPAGEYVCHGRGSDGADSGVWAGIGCAFESGRDPSDAWQGGIGWSETPVYSLRSWRAFAGVAVAHLMFGLPLFAASTHVRSGPAQMFSEFVATFGLLVVILGCVRSRPAAVPFAVGAYISGCLLVHRIHIVCEPCCYDRPLNDEYVCGSAACGCGWIRCCSVGGRFCGDAALPVAHTLSDSLRLLAGARVRRLGFLP